MIDHFYVLILKVILRITVIFLNLLIVISYGEYRLCLAALFLCFRYVLPLRTIVLFYLEYVLTLYGAILSIEHCFISLPSIPMIFYDSPIGISFR